jgi:hypothetical protein
MEFAGGLILETTTNRLLVDVVFHSIAFTLNDHGFGVVKEPVKDGRGEHAVVVEDCGPLIVGPI